MLFFLGLEKNHIMTSNGYAFKLELSTDMNNTNCSLGICFNLKSVQRTKGKGMGVS